MKKTFVLSIVLIVCISSYVSADTFAEGSVNEFTIDFVTISGDTNPTSGYGIVNNDYCMGTYEITNGQLSNFQAAYGTVTGSPSNAYDQNPYFPGTQIPANRISWYEAAQFVNWLNTNTGHQEAYKFTGTVHTSNYTLAMWDVTDVGYDVSNPFRNSNAFYFLPTEDEWVKAAYWNDTSLQQYATKAGQDLFQGNGSNGGWNYAEGSDAGPDGIGLEGPWNVGSGSQELNGTYDMMGNLWEWMESPLVLGDYLTDSIRSLRGGLYSTQDIGISSSSREDLLPHYESGNVGFRVASIPEPVTLSLLALGGLTLIRKRK